MVSICTPSHNPKYLGELWECLKNQSVQDFEWVILGQKETTEEVVRGIVGTDPRVSFTYSTKQYKGIGEIKNECFMSAKGNFLLEVDHDDLITRDCLLKVQLAFIENGADFVYSDCADFSPTGAPVTYHDQGVRKAWEDCGWKFREVEIEGRTYIAPFSWKPSPASISHIYYAPNHIRAWRADFYRKIGGHNKDFTIVDDHELLIRTYLQGHMFHIPEVLYLYRVETNTWSKSIDEILKKTTDLQEEYLEQIVLRDCQLRGLPAIELGGGINPRKGWVSCDVKNGTITADLNQTWPFADGSVGAFRASDLLEHLPNKQFTMSEIYRCLAPGGVLMSFTPSAMGAGAFCDPTHVSYWVRRSFDYYTDKNVAQFIYNDSIRFMPIHLYEFYPSTWHKQENIPYVKANLVKLDGVVDSTIPGIKRI